MSSAGSRRPIHRNAAGREGTGRLSMLQARTRITLCQGSGSDDRRAKRPGLPRGRVLARFHSPRGSSGVAVNPLGEVLPTLIRVRTSAGEQVATNPSTSADNGRFT